jgi:hypothetical protein
MRRGWVLNVFPGKNVDNTEMKVRRFYDVFIRKAALIKAREKKTKCVGLTTGRKDKPANATTKTGRCGAYGKEW